MSEERNRVEPPHYPAAPRFQQQAREMAVRYPILLEPDDEAGYVGSVPEMPAVWATGPTPDECVHNTREVLADALALVLEMGYTPPRPRVSPRMLVRRHTPEASGRWGVTALRILLWLAAAVGIIAWLLVVFVDVESVLVTGPLLLVLGLLLLVMGGVHRRKPVAALGAGHMGVCILFFLLVLIFGWGPGEARTPFIVMGLIYLAITTPLTALVSYRMPPVRRPFGVCEKCGYLLYGLSEPRCPECGTGFDAALLPRLQAMSADSGRGP